MSAKRPTAFHPTTTDNFRADSSDRRRLLIAHARMLAEQGTEPSMPALLEAWAWDGDHDKLAAKLANWLEGGRG